MLDAQKWIETTFGGWSWRMLGIAALSAALIILTVNVVYSFTGCASSQYVELPKPGTRVPLKRWLNRNDPRAFVKIDPQSLRTADQAYDIAWISGSAIAIRKAPPEWRVLGQTHYEMTTVLARMIHRIGGRPARIHEYMLQGARSADMRRAILNASNADEIDAIIVEFNPIWFFNEWLQYTVSRQQAEVVTEPLATWFDWGLTGRAVRPSAFGLALISGQFPVVRDRQVLLGQSLFHSKIAFPYKKLAKGAAKDGILLSTWQRILAPETLDPKLAAPKDIGPLIGHRNVLFLTNLDKNGLPARILRENIRTLADSGKPVVLFTPPVNPLMKKDPLAVARMNKILALLEEIVAEVHAPNILLHTRSLWDAPIPFQHSDSYHLHHGQGVVGLVADLLELATKQHIEPATLHWIYGPPNAKPAKKPAQPVRAQTPVPSVNKSAAPAN